MAVGSFGSKIFDITEESMVYFTDLSYKASLKTTENNVAGGKNTLTVNGISLDTFTINVHLRYPFVDVRAEIDSWMALLRAKAPYPFVIGGQVYGAQKFLLTSVSNSKPDIGPLGVFTQAVLALTFTEYSDGSGAAGAAAISTKSKAKSTRKKKKEPATRTLDDGTVAVHVKGGWMVM